MRIVNSTMVVMLILALHSRLSAQMADGHQADEYPIIAQLYADPARYASRSVIVYGVVIEAGPGATFILQDVSQRPLKIVADQKASPAVGDQLMVLGFFHADANAPFLSAKALIPTQVVAGGGCC
jgi:hypothetical protein